MVALDVAAWSSTELPVWLLAAVASFVVAALAGWPARWLARKVGAIDVPGGRHRHRQPTPRLGGLAVLGGVAVGGTAGMLLAAASHVEVAERLPRLLAVLLVAGGVCLLGAVDDVRSLRPSRKLLGLAGAGVLIVLAGVRIEFLELPWLGKVALGPWAGCCTVLWVLACTNAVNLIDGVDGLGAGVVGSACLALALLAYGMGDTASVVAFVAVGAASAGFLVHNREPARLFLGDSGSLLLGFLLAAISADGCTKRATATFLVAALLTLAVPLLDSTHAFLRRFRRAAAGCQTARWWQRLRATSVGDHEHVHHRLLGRGLSHRQVARHLCLGALVPGTTALLLVPAGGIGLLTLFGCALASGVVLWRLFAMPRALKPTVAEAERKLVMPSLPPRRKGEPAVGEPHQLV